MVDSSKKNVDKKSKTTPILAVDFDRTLCIRSNNVPRMRVFVALNAAKLLLEIEGGSEYIAEYTKENNINFEDFEELFQKIEEDPLSDTAVRFAGGIFNDFNEIFDIPHTDKICAKCDNRLMKFLDGLDYLDMVRKIYETYPRIEHDAYAAYDGATLNEAVLKKIAEYAESGHAVVIWTDNIGANVKYKLDELGFHERLAEAAGWSEPITIPIISMVGGEFHGCEPEDIHCIISKKHPDSVTRFRSELEALGIPSDGQITILDDSKKVLNRLGRENVRTIIVDGDMICEYTPDE